MKSLMKADNLLLQQFLANYGAVSKLRNAMDHINQNIGNLASAAGHRPPLFGAFSYIVLKEGVIGKSCVVVTLTSGATPGGRAESPLLNPVGRELRVPVSQFQLDAFEQTLAIDSAIRDLRHLVDDYQTKFEDHCNRETQRLSREKGIPVDELRKPLLNQVSMVTKFEFSPQDYD
jgi:hypothetical protein